MELYVLPGSAKYDLPSLDGPSLVAASYLQLVAPGKWTLIECTDTSLSPNGALPFLKDGDRLVPQQQIGGYLTRAASQPAKLTPTGEETAFHALIDAQLLPLVLHSLFSLPQNWAFVRPLLSETISFPARFYRPEHIRRSAEADVVAGHADWWGLGGEAEHDEEAAKRQKKALMGSGIEGMKDRLDEQKKEGKEKMRRTFGEGKILASARALFTSLETTLAQSSTPFFFSRSSPSFLDAHLSSLLSLVLYLPLPQPLLSGLINASFPRLWTHTALLRRTLWSGSSPSLNPSPNDPRAAAATPSGLPRVGAPRHGVNPAGAVADVVAAWAGGERVGPRERGNETWVWFTVVAAVGLVGWGLGTGAIAVGLPSRPTLDNRDWDNDDEP